MNLVPLVLAVIQVPALNAGEEPTSLPATASKKGDKAVGDT